jgi:hypothetical protein
MIILFCRYLNSSQALAYLIKNCYFHKFLACTAAFINKDDCHKYNCTKKKILALNSVYVRNVQESVLFHFIAFLDNFRRKKRDNLYISSQKHRSYWRKFSFPICCLLGDKIRVNKRLIIHETKSSYWHTRRHFSDYILEYFVQYFFFFLI